jgi:hypothetical protein
MDWFALVFLLMSGIFQFIENKRQKAQVQAQPSSENNSTDVDNDEKKHPIYARFCTKSDNPQSADPKRANSHPANSQSANSQSANLQSANSDSANFDDIYA